MSQLVVLVVGAALLVSPEVVYNYPLHGGVRIASSIVAWALGAALIFVSSRIRRRNRRRT
jgi:hypothetical protein